jgi:hypothetical protein
MGGTGIAGENVDWIILKEGRVQWHYIVKKATDVTVR